jgi:hypothetical protein
VVDLFSEAGLGYMRDHLQGGGEPAIEERFTFGKGFPLGWWSRRCDGEKPPASSRRPEVADRQVPGGRWDG